MSQSRSSSISDSTYSTAEDAEMVLASVHSHGAVLILAHALDDIAVGCTNALQLFARQARRVYIITATEVGDQPTSADRPAVLSPSENPLSAENDFSRSVQILNWDLEPAALGYTENTIGCLTKLIDSTNASLVLAPSITEQHPARFAMGLSALESIRRLDGSCLLGYYFIAASADASQMHLQSGYRLRLLRFRPPDGSRITDAVVSEQSSPVDNPTSRQTAIDSYVMLLELISPADTVEPIAYLHERTFPNLIGQPSADPLVSIIIRTTNRPELSDALASIAAQTYTHIEVLLVDVAGTESLHVGEHCGAFPVRVVSTGCHLNRSAAANAGLDAALGDYVCFLDDDDWLYPKHVHVLASALKPGQPARAAYVGVECRKQNAAGNWEIIQIFNERFDPVRLLIENYLPIHAVMFDRNMVGPELGFDEQFDVYEDWDFWIQLSQLTPFIHVDWITAVYRISSNSGFGVRSDDPAIASGTKALFGKWRKRWSDSQVVDFIQYQKLRIQEQAQQTQQQTQTQTARITELERELAELTQDRTIQQQRVTALETESKEHDTSYQASIEEIAQLRDKLCLLQQELATSTTANTTNKRLCVNLSKRVDARELELETAQQEIDSLRSIERRIRLYRPKMLDAESRISQYSRGLNQLHSAAIWPITSRLHALESRLPRLTRGIMAAQKALWWTLGLQIPARMRLRSHARKILASGLFDEQWYMDRYPDVVLSGYLPVFHWCLLGWKQGYYPSLLFHTSWYQNRYSDELQADQDPLLHYIDHAKDHYLNPNPLFDARWYVSNHPEAQTTSATPLLHYLTIGWKLGLSPHPLFDITWYLRENPIVAESHMEPLAHYFEMGAYDDCDPHPLFMSSWYLDRNPDVFLANINPLYHYLSFGASEGRNPNPKFDSDWYMASNIDVVNAGLNPLVHYVLFGASEARSPHPDFDPDEYQAAHPSVDWSTQNPLVHFLRDTQASQSTGGFAQIIPEAKGNAQQSKTIDPAYARWLQVNPLGANRIRSLILGSGLSPRTRTGCGDLEPGAELDALLSQVEQVTFDLFDTLVERATTEPADVFQLVGMNAPKQFGGAERYAKARIMAETRARENAAGEEVTLEAIFAELAAEAGLTDQEIALLRHRELEIEETLIQIKPSGRRLYDRAADNGKQISILTDTYLPRSFVESILKNTGYDQHQALFVSSHVNATKHFGTLFQLWQQQTGSSPGSVLHIGDNRHSDVSVPKRLGFKTLQVERSVDLFRGHTARAAAWPEASITDPSMRLLQGLVANRLAKIGQQSHSSAPYLGNPYLLGYATLGPLLVGFTAGLLDFAARHHVRHFYFLARDGYVMKAAYDLVAVHFSEPLPPSHYIAASRALCSAAGIDSTDRIREVASVPHRPMSISALLRNRFGLDAQQICSLPQASYSEHQIKGPDEPLTESDSRKFSFLDSIAGQLIALSSERAERYATYLNSLPIRFPGAALVDIGYAGSAQQVLARLVNQPLKGFYAITSDRIESLKTAGLVCEGWLADGVPMAEHWLFEHVQAWEMFLSASHGSALDIQQAVDGTYQWILDDNLFDPSVRRTLAAVHQGAVDCVQDFVEHHQADFLCLRFDPQHCSTPLRQFFTAPAAEDCIGLADAVFEDRFGGDVRKMAAICHPDALTLAALKQAIVWHEATAALSAAHPDLSAFASSLPPPPNADASQATNLFIDGFEGTDILPSWHSDPYRQTFDSDGWRKPTANASNLRLVLPLPHLDDQAEAALRSIGAQRFPGLTVTVLCFVETDNQAVLQMLGSIPTEIRTVASWSELTHLMHSFAEPWIVLTDGYTILNEEFSAEIIARIKARPRADMILVDDDWQRPDESLIRPHFKPEWSRELLLSTDYFGGVYIVRKALLDGLISSCTTASGWLWELALHVATKTDHIERIPRILAHRSMERHAAELGQAQTEMTRVMQHTFDRLGSNARIETPGWAIEHGRLACQPRFPDHGPRVAIIIPTKNQHRLVKRCIDSIRSTTYQNYQIYLVDNESDDPKSIAYFEFLTTQGVQLLRINNPTGEFSYSYVNNRASEQTQDEEYLLFLNNDTEVIEPHWLSQMVGWQQLPAVGSVGARLLFPNKTVQHAGITQGLLYNVLPAPSLKCEPADKGGYQDYLYLNRNSAAQTAACLLTPRSTFVQYGMFDEGPFAVAYNDCDYGFKLTQAGLRNIYCADAVLYHHEGYSRGTGQGNDKPSEEAAFVRKYASWSDPYYSPNLALGRTDFALQPVSTITTPIPRLKIALVTHNLKYEGAPLVLSDIGTGLQRFGIADVLVLSPKDGPLRAAYEAQGCQVQIHSNSGGVFRSDANGLETVASVAALYIEYGIDVVLANTVLCWWGIEAAAMARLPSLWVIHESEPPFTHLAEHSEACAQRGRRALALPYRVVFVADATREVFAELETSGNFAVYHNGYKASDSFNALSSISRQQARQELDLPQDAVIGLLPGTVCERKSQIDLLHAVKSLSTDTLEKLLLIILGDRPSDYSTALHEQLSRLEPPQRNSILVLDHCPGAETYFRAADFMLSTSRIEAFPRIVQEAMWFELAMIVAPVYGIKEQVQDEVSALFFPVGDAGALAQQIERLVSEPELRRRLAVNARATLDRFPSVDEMVWYYGRLAKQAWLSKP